MKTELVIKKWAVEDRKGVPTITGTYSVMLGDKEIASSLFNGEFGGTPITFERELQDLAKDLANKISESIQASFV